MTDLDDKPGIDFEPFGGHADPLSAVGFILGAISTLKLLTGWRDDWQERTTVGRIGFALFAPFRMAFGVITGVFALTFGLVILAEVAVSAGPRYLYRGYKRRAFKEVTADD